MASVSVPFPARTRCAAAVLAVLALLAAAPALAAQGLLGIGRSSSAAKHDTAGSQRLAGGATEPGSPRAAVMAFLRLTAHESFDSAASYLDLTDAGRDEGPRLARELRAVLNQYVVIDPDLIPGAAAGDTSAGAQRGLVQIGVVPGAGGTSLAVRLVRLQRGGEPRWLFSRGTVQHVPEWYGSLPDRWARDHLPGVLLHHALFGLALWQWLALPLLLAVAWALGALLNRILAALLIRAARRTATQWDDTLIERLGAPVTLALAAAIAAALLQLIALGAQAQGTIAPLLKAVFAFAFFWALLRLVDVWRQVMAASGWALAGGGAQTLLPLVSRVAKLAVVAIGLVAVLSALGFPVAGVLGGLGIGALAVALAAQKTVENLFGAFSIGADRVFREGDVIKVGDVTGTVESIGLRSTRLRTMARTLITLPNGQLADSRIESFRARDRLYLGVLVGLVYETTARQMREVLDGFERVLHQQPRIWPETVRARFVEMAASSLNVQVDAWFQTTDWDEFLRIRQEVLLQFMDVVERAGSGFAFPSQTVYVKDGATPVAAAPVNTFRPGGV